MKLASTLLILLGIIFLFQNCGTEFESNSALSNETFNGDSNFGGGIIEVPTSSTPTHLKKENTIINNIHFARAPVLSFTNAATSLYIDEWKNHIQSGQLNQEAAVCEKPENEINNYYAGRITRFEFYNIIEDVFGVLEGFGNINQDFTQPKPLHHMSSVIAENQSALTHNTASLRAGTDLYKKKYEDHRLDRLRLFTDSQSELAKIISAYPIQNEENYFNEMNRLFIETGFMGTMLAIGEQLGELIVTRLGHRNNLAHPGYIAQMGCEKVNKIDCIDILIKRVVPILWKKKLTKEELESFNKFKKNINNLNAIKSSFKKIIQVAVASPQFFIKRALSYEHDLDARNTVLKLSHLELANRLAFFLTSSVPDPILYQDAINSQDDFNLTPHIDRLLNSEKTKKRFTRSFFGSVLNINNSLADTSVFREEKFGNGESIQQRRYYLANTTIHQLESYFNKSISSLVTEEKIIGNSALWMNSLNKPQETSIIRRGIYIFERLLCGETPEPTAVQDLISQFQNNQANENLTNRDILEQHTSHVGCIGCHSKFDPLGFPYEKFNALGDWREFYHGEIGNNDKRITTNSLVGLNGEHTVQNHKDLQRLIASSVDYKSCVTNHLTNKFSRLNNRAPQPCNMTYSYNANDNPSLSQLVKNIILSPTFQYVTPGEGE